MPIVNYADGFVRLISTFPFLCKNCHAASFYITKTYRFGDLAMTAVILWRAYPKKHIRKCVSKAFMFRALTLLHPLYPFLKHFYPLGIGAHENKRLHIPGQLLKIKLFQMPKQCRL